MMDWHSLLNTERLGRKTKDATEQFRSPFRKDFDRIVFSSAFRRMQDKTQVFPLSESDYVRTRLTHSIEVASVGRSLGALAGRRIIDKLKSAGQPIPLIGDEPATPHDFGDIVAAACLAHDIGNPPFGHSGEAAIRCWFEENKDCLSDLEEAEQLDLLNFEGNAQGFRQLTRLLHQPNEGGLQLTYAVLGTFTKYPRSAICAKKSGTKFGFTQNDAASFSSVAENLKLEASRRGIGEEAWCRHPLAFLVEAADDICYGIVDFEDGIRRHCVPEQQGQELLIELIRSAEGKDVPPDTDSRENMIAYLRARAIGALVMLAADEFDKYLESSLQSGWSRVQSLIKSFPEGPRDVLKEIGRISKDKIYGAPRVLQIEAAGFEVIGCLLDRLVSAVLSKRSSKKEEKFLQLFPHVGKGCSTVYEKLLSVVDAVSGMTDTFALAKYRLLSGIEVPRA